MICRFAISNLHIIGPTDLDSYRGHRIPCSPVCSRLKIHNRLYSDPRRTVVQMKATQIILPDFSVVHPEQVLPMQDDRRRPARIETCCLYSVRCHEILYGLRKAQNLRYTVRLLVPDGFHISCRDWHLHEYIDENGE